MTSQNQDVVDLLLAQHEHIRSMFTAVESVAGDAKQEKFEELRRFLAVHETAEELVTHPNARTAEGGNDVVDARLEEETDSKRMLADLDGMSVDEPGFDTRFVALKTAVLVHAEAHPSAGSSMTTNLVAGPLASLIDRTRDTVNRAMA